MRQKSWRLGLRVIAALVASINVAYVAACAKPARPAPSSSLSSTQQEQSTPNSGTLGAGTLGQLAFRRSGRIAHFSSSDVQGGNADARHIAPGQSLTLVDYRGAGTVRRWWLTIAPRNNVAVQRNLIVRCWWDDEREPSVEVPVTDFFGVGFGEWRQFISLPLSMTSGGYNCYWPMPFFRHARITVENRSAVPVDAFYYNIDIETQTALPRDALYFHAQFRRARTQRGKPVTILETSGHGHYVGTLLSMQPLRGRDISFLEGDEAVFVDGETKPSISGTGTEDYFNSGWYFDTGVYSAPYHGLTIKDDATSRISAYRWHIEDRIAFSRSLRFEMEHGAHNDGPPSDYSSVAFWYQTHPHAKFPPLPADLMPYVPQEVPRIKDMIEGESLLDAAKATAGQGGVQGMESFADETTGLEAFKTQWSGLSQLWWTGGAPGAQLKLKLNAPAAGDYSLQGYFTRATDYGDFRVLVNGQVIGEKVSGYAPAVSSSGAVALGRVRLQMGSNELTLEITGKDARSSNFMLGIDGFVLQKIP